MADRLQELLQQRALIKEHLAWIEAEIAAASGRPAALPPATPAATPNRLTPTSNPVIAAALGVGAGPDVPAAVPAAAVETEADVLLAKLIAEERRIPPPDKKGCWIIFLTTLFLFVGLGIGLFKFFHR